jgi:hypothetical protein
MFMADLAESGCCKQQSERESEKAFHIHLVLTVYGIQ